MKKNTLKFVALALVSSGFSPAWAPAAPIEHPSIRIFQTVSEFSQAVRGGQVYLDLGRDIALEKGVGQAEKYMDTSFQLRKDDGSLKELVVSCMVSVDTRAARPKLSATARQPNKWIVTGVENVEHRQRWSLRKAHSPAMILDCSGAEKDGSKIQNITLTPSMVDKVLSDAGARFKTSISPQDLNVSSENLNQGLGAPASTVQ